MALCERLYVCDNVNVYGCARVCGAAETIQPILDALDATTIIQSIDFGNTVMGSHAACRLVQKLTQRNGRVEPQTNVEEKNYTRNNRRTSAVFGGTRRKSVKDELFSNAIRKRMFALYSSGTYFNRAHITSLDLRYVYVPFVDEHELISNDVLPCMFCVCVCVHGRVCVE